MQWEAIKEYYAEECDQKYCLKNLLWLLWAEWVGSGGTVAVVQGEMTDHGDRQSEWIQGIFWRQNK